MMVLQKAWWKKIQFGERMLSFDHDYTTAVVQQRKSYKNIKNVLEEEGISL